MYGQCGISNFVVYTRSFYAPFVPLTRTAVTVFTVNMLEETINQSQPNCERRIAHKLRSTFLGTLNNFSRRNA